MEEECEDEIQLSCATSTLSDNNNYGKKNNRNRNNNNKSRNNQTASEACRAGEKEVCTEVTDFLVHHHHHHHHHHFLPEDHDGLYMIVNTNIVVDWR